MGYVTPDQTAWIPAMVFIVPDVSDGGKAVRAKLEETFIKVRRATDPWRARRELARKGVRYNSGHFSRSVRIELGSDYISVKRRIGAHEGRSARTIQEKARHGQVIIVDSLFNVTVMDADVFEAVGQTAREIVDE